MKGVDEYEWGVGVACGGVWRGGVITPEAGYTGPMNVSRVRFPDGTPLWRRRAQARIPPEDPEYLMAMCRAQALEAQAQKDPGRSLFLLCLYSLSLSAMFLSHLIHAHTHTHTTIHTRTRTCPTVPESHLPSWIAQSTSFCLSFTFLPSITWRQRKYKIAFFISTHFILTYLLNIYCSQAIFTKNIQFMERIANEVKDFCCCSLSSSGTDGWLPSGSSRGPPPHPAHDSGTRRSSEAWGDSHTQSHNLDYPCANTASLLPATWGVRADWCTIRMLTPH